jgi:hypothetical protein
MQKAPAIAVLSRLSAPSLGVFRGREATEHGVTRDQLTLLRAAGAIERIYPDTYCMTAVVSSHEQKLRAALLWGGSAAAATGRSAAMLYGLERVSTDVPEIVLPRRARTRAPDIILRHGSRGAFMPRRVRDLVVTGPEYTLLWLAHELDEEALEIACEDARRRRLTSVPALRAYLQRYGRPGRPGVAAMRKLLDQLDPAYAARSTLEVKTRRLLVANRVTRFKREFPLEWEGRRYLFDFAFERERTILETNGRRWHDDAADYEDDNDKWSVPGRYGFYIVFATWEKVTARPREFISELRATFAA